MTRNIFTSVPLKISVTTVRWQPPPGSRDKKKQGAKLPAALVYIRELGFELVQLPLEAFRIGFADFFSVTGVINGVDFFDELFFDGTGADVDLFLCHGAAC